MTAEHETGTDILRQICADKADHVRTAKARLPQREIEHRLGSAPALRGFAEALWRESRAGRPALIAEIKKASPSRGVIRADFDPPKIAKAYESAGAACLSILTDTPYFHGQDSYLETVRAHVGLPVLRKDFMIDPYQIFESRLLGADCILLIMAALSDSLAEEMNALARSLGMDVLVEVHDSQELARAIPLAPPLIGINSRNLRTMQVDLDTARRLVSAIPEGTLRIAESGLRGHPDLADLHGRGFHGFLVGESLMAAPDIAQATRALLTGTCAETQEKT